MVQQTRARTPVRCTVVFVEVALPCRTFSCERPLRVVPAAWWDFIHEAVPDSFFGSTSKRGREQEWDGLYRVADWGLGSHHRFAVSSEADAARVSREMTDLLMSGFLADALDLLGPGRMLAAVRSGRISEHIPYQERLGQPDMVLAVLVTEVAGPELEQVCRRLDQFEGREFSAIPLATAAWARARYEKLHGH